MKKKILLFGAGSHANSCIDILKLSKNYKIYGLIGKKNEIGKIISGYKVLGTDQDAASFIKRGIKHALITFADYKNQSLRLRLFKNLKKLNFIFPTIISPYANVSKLSKILEGTIVMHGAIINSNSIIGRNCIVNTKALIEHDCRIGDNVHISTGSILNGSVSVGSQSFIGSGSVIRNNLNIKKNSFIKMGTILKK